MAYDLRYDPNDVGGDLLVTCRISRGPRAVDAGFDPRAGDVVVIGDDEEEPLPARVVERDGDRVLLQVRLDSAVDAVA